MRKYLAVFSAEKGYAERLCRALARKENFQLTPVAFEEAADLNRFCGTHPAAAILADEEPVAEGAFSGLAGRPVQLPLTESPEEEARSGGICRYQSVEGILHRLTAALGEDAVSGILQGNGRSVRLIAVYSPSLPSVKTAFAVTLAAMEKRLRRTLYLNLEEFGGTGMLFKGNGEKNLSDAVYLLKQDALDGAKLASMICTSGSVDYIPAMPFADDVKEAGGEEWVRLINRIAEVSEYEEIVVDLPESLYVSQEVIDVCDELYLPVGGDSISAARFRELERYMERPEHRHMQEKARRVRLNGTGFPAAEDSSDYPEELMYGSFGDEVLREVSRETGRD